MNILYLHGLDSTLQDDRRAVLAPYGHIHAPELNYRANPNLLLQSLATEYAEVHAIIGSSAGGLVGYYLAQKLLKPCLLLNPALTYRNELPVHIQPNPHYAAYMQVVIGLQDTVIDPWLSLQALKSDLQLHQPAEIHLINNMAHSYPIGIFEQEVKRFFNKLSPDNSKFKTKN